MNAESSDRLIVRPRPPHDGATPSGASLIAEVFARLHHIGLESRWRDAAERAARRHAETSPRGRNRRCCWRRSICSSAAAKSWSKGEATTRGRSRWRARRSPLRTRRIVTLRLDPARWPDGAPGGRPRLPAPPAAMLCRGQVCSLPVADAAGLRALLAER